MRSRLELGTYLCDFGGTDKWSLHLCEVEKRPPHRISGSTAFEIHIITRFCRTGGAPPPQGAEGPPPGAGPPPRESAGRI